VDSVTSSDKSIASREVKDLANGIISLLRRLLLPLETSFLTQIDFSLGKAVLLSGFTNIPYGKTPCWALPK
jgi:hypothetical protein